MTSPENFRRRQRIEGLILILLAIFTVAQAIYFQVDNSKQQQCINGKFLQLSNSLDARGKLTTRESNATRRVFFVYSRAAGLVKDNPTKPLDKKTQHMFQRQLVRALMNYQKEIDAIQKERREHPLPPYTVGTCRDR